MQYTLKYFTILLLFYSCQNNSSIANKTNEATKLKTIEHLKWLVGTWKSVSNDGILYENWKIENDSLLIGKGFLISGKDTLFSEKLQLQQRATELFYMAT